MPIYNNRPPPPPCTTQRCVEDRRENATATLWYLALALVAAAVLAIGFRIWIRVLGRRAAAKRRARERLAQQALTDLFDDPTSLKPRRRAGRRPNAARGQRPSI